MSKAIRDPQDSEQKLAPQDAEISAASEMVNTAAPPNAGIVLDQSASLADTPHGSTLPRDDASVQMSAEVPIGRSAVTSETNGVVPANEGACGCNNGDSQPVFFIGELSYDFGTEARRDSFKQQMGYVMAPAKAGGEVAIPPNPYDHNQMADHLEEEPEEATQLIWTLNLDLQPIYVIEPYGPYAESIYDFLRIALKNQIREKDEKGNLLPEYVERISVAGKLTGKTVRLFSGQQVPVVRPRFRLLFSWEVNKLIELAIQTAKSEPEGVGISENDKEKVHDNLRQFLDRIYYDLRNLGVSARDRAINYSATNAFQAAQTMVDATKGGYQLSEIQSEKSPFCRMYSDCWDVKLRFFDPENVLRAKRVFRFTVDVSDTTPVTVGDIRTWTEA
jgi:cyanobactin maturation PatA/PatG family protease